MLQHGNYLFSQIFKIINTFDYIITSSKLPYGNVCMYNKEIVNMNVHYSSVYDRN
jgi:hypothetical protein